MHVFHYAIKYCLLTQYLGTAMLTSLPVYTKFVKVSDYSSTEYAILTLQSILNNIVAIFPFEEWPLEM